MLSNYETNLKYRKIDEEKDEWIFGHGEQDFLHGIDAMRQVIVTRLKAIAGEWWEGDATAIPYFDDVLAAPATSRQKDIIDLYIIERITDTIGVLSVKNIESEIVDRKYSFSCVVQTIYGETSVGVVL